jgi:hypothetical protein
MKQSRLNNFSIKIFDLKKNNKKKLRDARREVLKKVTIRVLLVSCGISTPDMYTREKNKKRIIL